MEHLSLEIFDRIGNGSQNAYLAGNCSITITDTSEIFASGDVWSLPFSLNVVANAKIFGTSGDVHGSRLHEQLNGRRARLWVDGLPLYLGYLKLDDEVDVDGDGNIDVTFEGGQKTFDEQSQSSSDAGRCADRYGIVAEKMDVRGVGVRSYRRVQAL